MKKTSASVIAKKYSNYILIAVLTLIFAILYYSGNLTSRSFITPNMLTQIGYTMILVISLNLVVGFLGELSLGHAGFMYIGAYAAGLFSHYTESFFTAPLLRLILSMAVGGIVAAIFGFIVGLPALRLRGDYLAIVTLAFGEIVRGVLKNIKIPGFIDLPANGFSLPRYSQSLFIVAFVATLFTIFCVQNLVNSKHGRAIMAIRDNEIAARSMGINITYYKLMVFAISSFLAGMAGAIFAHNNAVIYSTFNYNYSIEFLVMVVLGGMGSILGSIISSIFLVIINIQLQSSLSGNLAGLKYLVYALILIITMIFNASPKFAPLREKLNWKYLISKLRKKKESPAQTGEDSDNKSDATQDH